MPTKKSSQDSSKPAIRKNTAQSMKKNWICTMTLFVLQRECRRHHSIHKRPEIEEGKTVLSAGETERGSQQPAPIWKGVTDRWHKCWRHTRSGLQPEQRKNGEGLASTGTKTSGGCPAFQRGTLPIILFRNDYFLFRNQKSPFKNHCVISLRSRYFSVSEPAMFEIKTMMFFCATKLLFSKC